jgi:hypothetical protein
MNHYINAKPVSEEKFYESLGYSIRYQYHNVDVMTAGFWTMICLAFKSLFGGK